jgi:hypothetical protein
MYSRHENINIQVQMYADILSEILMGEHKPRYSRDVGKAIIKVNGLILKYPLMVCYKNLRKELVHLEDLIYSMRSPSNKNFS